MAVGTAIPAAQTQAPAASKASSRLRRLTLPSALGWLSSGESMGRPRAGETGSLAAGGRATRKVAPRFARPEEAAGDDVSAAGGSNRLRPVGGMDAAETEPEAEAHQHQ